MRIGYFADGLWSHKALEYILQHDDFQIVFIVGRYDTADPILRGYADSLNVPFLLHPNVNSSEFIEKILEYSPDINVSMSFNQILKADILNIASKGFINCHAGALPYYRGRNILNWALINGESQFGVTVHYIDEGIDTGDIILQRFADIDITDDYDSILKKAIELCAIVLCDALVMIKNGTEARIKQDTIHPHGFYCGRRGEGDEWMDWNWTSERIYNFIRAITFPGPGARTYLNGKVINLWKAELISNAPTYIGKTGEVVGRNEQGIVVKTGDTTILITEISSIDAISLSPSMKVLPRFPIGTCFENYSTVEIKKLKTQIRQLEETIVGKRTYL